MCSSDLTLTITNIHPAFRGPLISLFHTPNISQCAELAYKKQVWTILNQDYSTCRVIEPTCVHSTVYTYMPYTGSIQDMHWAAFSGGHTVGNCRKTKENALQHDIEYIVIKHLLLRMVGSRECWGGSMCLLGSSLHFTGTYWSVGSPLYLVQYIVVFFIKHRSRNSRPLKCNKDATR